MWLSKDHQVARRFLLSVHWTPLKLEFVFWRFFLPNQTWAPLLEECYSKCGGHFDHINRFWWGGTIFGKVVILLGRLFLHILGDSPCHCWVSLMLVGCHCSQTWVCYHCWRWFDLHCWLETSFFRLISSFPATSHLGDFGWRSLWSIFKAFLEITINVANLKTPFSVCPQTWSFISDHSTFGRFY